MTIQRKDSSINKPEQEEDVTSQANSPPALECEKLLYTSQSVISELDRQLEEWRACLPSSIQFPSFSWDQVNDDFEPRPFRDTHERLKGNLMARYFAAKGIIHRSFVYRALHRPSLTETEKVGARVSINAAILSVSHSGLLHEPMALLLHPINSCRRYLTFYIPLLRTCTDLLAFTPLHCRSPSLLGLEIASIWRSLTPEGLFNNTKSGWLPMQHHLHRQLPEIWKY